MLQSSQFLSLPRSSSSSITQKTPQKPGYYNIRAALSGASSQATWLGIAHQVKDTLIISSIHPLTSYRTSSHTIFLSRFDKKVSPARRTPPGKDAHVEENRLLPPMVLRDRPISV